MTSTARPSRRGFLVGTGLAVLGAAGGLTAGLLVDRSPDEVDAPNPAVLFAAIQAEQELIAVIDGIVPGSRGPSAAVLQNVRSDHEAHRAALVASVAVIVGSASPSVAPPPRRPQKGLSAAELRKIESSAASAAARRALALTGRDATLLASIAACEATHAELLS